MTNSPYASCADTLRENGYHVMPTVPGEKVPGAYYTTGWHRMNQWQAWCDSIPPAFMHEKWLSWPNAGICMAHGHVVGLDIDTDRKDVAEVAIATVGASPCQRRGQKGWMGYYRPGPNIGPHAARVRWYDSDGTICVELLLHGTQSVLPPTIHPGTGLPYKWITPDSLEDVEAADLPELPDDPVAKLDDAFAGLGLTRKAPRRVNGKDYGDGTPLPARSTATDHDLEKPFGRSLNDRAMEPDALDLWWPALELPKSRQRGRSGSWEAVPFWRASSSGRAISERNPNLKAVPSGIVDFGADRSYTPIDVVMAARDCSFQAAAEWLEGFVRAEEGGISAADALKALEQQLPEASVTKSQPEKFSPNECSDHSATRFQKRKGREPKKGTPPPPTKAQILEAFPAEIPPFPVQDYENDLTGLLREATMYIDESSNMWSQQGAFGAALAALGTVMGRMVEVSETGLRTNLYVIGTAESGAGKSSAMSAMSHMLMRCGVDDRLAGSDFTSGAAILKEAANGAPQLFNIDEFGDVIRRVLAPRAASHERDIGRILKDMYSAAAGAYKGKSYATQERQDIVEPHLCIYGVSTHEAFWESIDGRSFSDGLLARFIMIPIGETESQTPDHERSRMVAEMVEAMLATCRSAGNLGGTSCQSVKFDAGIWDRWMADRERFRWYARGAEKIKMPGAPSIINRVCENAMKIAMISAMGRKPDSPVISDHDYRLGIDVAQWSAIYMISSIDRYYVENASHRDLNRVLEYIETAGVEGRRRSEVIRAFRGIFVNAMASKAIMEALSEGGNIIAWQEPIKGRARKPTTWYVGAKYAASFLAKMSEDQETET